MRDNMLMSDLPVDLLEEILSRVPVTCLARLRSTCKRWNTLFKDPSFTLKNLRNAPTQPRVLMLKENRIFPTSVDLNVVPPSIEFRDALVLKDYKSRKVYDVDTVFHCDGLLLCTTKDSKLMVWNPCLGETRWIEQNDGRRYYHNKEVRGEQPRFALGYENNKSCRSYKILMFWDVFPYDIHEAKVDGFEIYDFNSNAWRVVNAPNSFVISSHGVNLKGNAYWSYSAGDNVHVHYVLSFDFTKERFKRLCLPPNTSHSSFYMGLSVVKEELSVLRYISDSTKTEMEMWVTNKMDTTCEADLSWSKFFSVDYSGFDVYTSLLIDEDKKVVLFNSHFWDDSSSLCTIGEEHEYYTEIQLYSDGSPSFLHHNIFSYVPSLVQINQDVVTKSGTFVRPRRRRGGRLRRVGRT